ncbi:NAD(P)-dependent alcohol dehydrogenase [Microbacterium sp. BK668]|uniref:NAD(P)-dependent alcohol dehydrogenase n=1 Tax=Microbacterium sp. BK668 TaxID=2512118 RepID=UPI00105CAFC0|nr:NAD(P)-dependent alcohol dehydrogenase [Microbacterium sp. BK668]TDN91415.1 NADPH:quinone reductase-like Zn-dependent oxidoreductase [Microbacterium sp. BK668]
MNRPTDAATPALPASMTAWRQSRYGGPEAVAAETVEVPVPAAGEVLLRVAATALNAADAHLMRGEPLLIRPFFGVRRPRRPVRGMDVAGTVVALGPDVDGLAVGDDVVGELPGGGLAPYATAPATRLVRRPPAISAKDAAALPMAAGTAWQALDLAGTAEGGRVLVLGASGGVGTYAVQLAAQRGAEVWALTGARSIELVTSLGASRVFDYALVQPGSGDLPLDAFDAVIDIAGRAPLRDLQRLLRPGGRVVLVGGEGGRVLGPVGRMLRAALLSLGSSRRIRSLAARANPDTLRELLSLVVSGGVRPVIEQTYPLASAREALAHVDGGHTLGKVVVTAD